MVKVSAVMPVYNVEKYLFRCLHSLVNQTLKDDYEIICINDGSTDNSAAVLEDFQKKYPDKIKIITQENKGISEARNAAMNLVRGKYTMFIDSDDFVALNTFEDLYNYAEKHDSQIVLFDFLRTDDTAGAYIRQSYDVLKEKFGEQIFNVENPDTAAYRYIPAGVWCKFYLTDFIKDIKFVPGIYNEDIPYWAEVFVKAKRINYYPVPFYIYVNDREDTVTFDNTKKSFEIIDAFSAAEEVLKKSGYFDKFANIHYTHLCSNLVFTLRKILPELRSDLVNEIKNYEADIDYDGIFNSDYFPFEVFHVNVIKYIRENDFDAIEKYMQSKGLWN